jgi:hypothetical protein
VSAAMYASGCALLLLYASCCTDLPLKYQDGSIRLPPARISPVLASSSRSQVTARAASAAACLTWERPSVDVRWRPPLAAAIVTHLVTRSLAPPAAPVASSMGAAGDGIS